MHTPTHRWRDTVAAVLASLVVAAAALIGMWSQALMVLVLASILIGIGSRIVGRNDIELGLVRRPLAPELRWYRRQLSIRVVFLAAFLTVMWQTIIVVGWLGPQASEWFTAIVVAAALLWIGLALFPRRNIGIANNVGLALAAVAVAVGWAAALAPTPVAVTLDCPLRAPMAVVQGGNTPITNHHWSLDSQRHALDVLVIRDGMALDADRSEGLAQTIGFGAEIVAPADGTVVTVVDGLADDESNLQQPAGNHVVIDMGDDRYVLLAHLQKDSVAVDHGASVRAGQLIGRLGNSGNSSMPHLHIQVQSKPNLYDQGNETFPIRFRDAAASRDGRRWRAAAALRRGDVIDPREPGAPVGE